jgi:hypothetical protein
MCNIVYDSILHIKCFNSFLNTSILKPTDINNLRHSSKHIYFLIYRSIAYTIKIMFLKIINITV